MEESEDNEEKAERRRKQRELECVGGGFQNTEWLVAIDNAGEVLVLHSSNSVQLVQRPFDPESGKAKDP